VILGNSGGGSLMAAYQAEAIAPTLVALLQGRRAGGAGDPAKADLYVSLNAHQGRPSVLTAWLDASGGAMERPRRRVDESLNPFKPDNGPPYSAEFITRYRGAQRARNQRITDWAKAELARLNDRRHRRPRRSRSIAAWGDLRFMDGPSIPPTGSAPWCYGAIRRPPTGPGSADQQPDDLALHVEPRDIQVPGRRPARQVRHAGLVVLGHGRRRRLPVDAQQIFDSLGSSDKELHLIPGAHYFEDSPARPASGRRPGVRLGRQPYLRRRPGA
jgi:hypothetical protein